MQYEASFLDRRTGDIVTQALGEWITVTEFGKRKSIGHRAVRHILHHAGLLQPEGDHGRFRLPYDMVEKGMGKRIDKPKSGYPFDVLSPMTVSLLDEGWDELLADYNGSVGKADVVKAAGAALADFEDRRITHPLSLMARIWWVRDHFPSLTHVQIGEVVGVQQPAVSKKLQTRDESRQRAKHAVKQSLPTVIPIPDQYHSQHSGQHLPHRSSHLPTTCSAMIFTGF